MFLQSYYRVKVGLLLLCLIASPLTYADNVEYLEIKAAEDTHIDSRSPDKNYGGLAWNFTSMVERTLLKFKLPYLENRQVVSAKLNISLYNTSANSQQVLLVDNSAWDENTVTWNTQPQTSTNSVGTLSNTKAVSQQRKADNNYSRSYDIPLSRDVLSRLSGTADQHLSLMLSTQESDGIYVVSQGHRHLVAKLKLETIPLEQVLEIPVAADNYVDERYPESNFASSAVLKVDAQPSERAYLAFDLSKLTRAQVISAKLRLKVTNPSLDQQQIRVLNDSNTDIASITLNNLPTQQVQPVAVLNGGAKNTWVELDLAEIVSAYKGERLALSIESTGSDGIDFVASGHADEPRLQVAYNPPQPIHNEMRLGINIDAPNWYGTEWPFIDLMKTSMAIWRTGCKRYGSQRDPGCASHGVGDNTYEQALLDLDENGWVRSLPEKGRYYEDGTVFTRVNTKVPTSLSPENPGGLYVVRYDGEGVITYSSPAKKIESASVPGRDVVEIVKRTNEDEYPKVFVLSILDTDPNKTGEYLRNIRVYPPGGVCESDVTQFCDTEVASNVCGGSACVSLEQAAEQGSVFDPRFLNNIKGYSNIRFMGYQDTNGAVDTKTWADRTRPEMRTYQRDHQDRGAIEVMTALGNIIDSDIWVNMPAKVDDDYIRRYAQLTLDTLESERKVYVEYSNEAWNFGFKMTYWMQEQAEALWPDVTDSKYFKGLNWYGMRSAQTCQIWKEVWADQPERIQCVVGTQPGWPQMMKLAVECPIWKARNGGKACYEFGFDALAVAPYFGHYIGVGGNLKYVEPWTQEPDGGLDRLFNELLVGGEIPGAEKGGALIAARRKMLSSKAYADKIGLKLVSYEGGQHLAATQSARYSEPVIKLLSDANRDPRMKEVYTRYLDYWSEIGGGLFNHWISVGSYGKWGNWGSKEYRDQQNAPKHDALIQYQEWLPSK